MKKYRNFILILSVVLLSLSGFYINLAYSTSKLPDFYLKQTSGDAKLLDNLELETIYNKGDFETYFTITNKGSHYQSELSFFGALDYWEKKTETAEINNLINQYPSFMRGKRNDTQLYHDANQVIYVGIDYDFSSNGGLYNFRLKINQLDKKTKDTKSFEVKLPHQEDSNYIDILDVQFLMGEVRVMILSEDETAKLHEYTINLKKEKIIADHTILQTDIHTEQQHYYIYRVTDINPTQNNTNFVFQVDKNISNAEGSQTAKIDLYAYNYETGKLDILKVPEEITKQLVQEGEFQIAYDSSSLYYVNLKEANGNQSISMLKYDFENQKITKNHTLQMEKEMSAFTINLYQNNLILTYRDENSKPAVKIVNFDNGESVFEGTVELKDTNQKVNYDNVYIDRVTGL